MNKTALITALTVALSGCNNLLINPDVSPAPAKDEAPGIYIPPVESEYRIQVGDRLAIASYYDPNLNQEVMVRPDGRISLLVMGDVDVAGITPTELDKIVTDAYGRVVDSPEITVIVKETANSGVYIGGEVRNQALQPLRGNMTAIQAITSAGGFLTTANRKQVLILRQQRDGQFQTYQMNMERVLLGEIPDVYLQRTDVIYVPKSTIANINQFVEQYINQIIPRSVQFTFAYQRIRTDQDSSITISPP